MSSDAVRNIEKKYVGRSRRNANGANFIRERNLSSIKQRWNFSAERMQSILARDRTDGVNFEDSPGESVWRFEKFYVGSFFFSFYPEDGV